MIRLPGVHGLLGVHKGVAALLAALVFGAALVVSALPRMVESSLDAAARSAVGSAPPGTTSLAVQFTRRPFDPRGMRTTKQVAKADTAWRALLPTALREVADPGRLYDFATSSPILIDDRAHRYMTLKWVSGAGRHVRYVKGGPPGRGSGTRVEVAVPAVAATEMSIRTGDTLRLGDLTVKVTGLFEPVRPADRFWALEPELTYVIHHRVPLAMDDDLIVTALADGDSLAGAELPILFRWLVTPAQERIGAGNAAAVLADTAEFGRRLGRQDLEVTLSTGLDRILAEYLQRLALTRALITVFLSGLAVVCLGTTALAVLLFAGRVRGDLLLMRARGASLARTMLTCGGAVALVAVPAAAAGQAAAGFVPGAPTAVARLGPAALAAGTIAIACAAALVRSGGRRSGNALRRIVLELLVLALAVASVHLLRTRGLGTGGLGTGGLGTGGLGTGDAFLAPGPVLLALAAALVVLRAGPALIHLVFRAAARRSGAVPFLGLAAARAVPSAALPVLTLLPAVALAAYGMVTAGGLEEAQRQAAWERTGAEIRVERAEGIAPETLEQIAHAPGVRAVVPAAVGTTVAEVGFGGRPATVVAVDLGAYHRLVAGSPLRLPPPGSGALVSRDLSAAGSFDVGWPARTTVTPAGTVDAMPGVAAGDGALIVLPGAPAQVNTLLIAGDPEAVRPLLPSGANMTTVAGALAEITGAPLTAALTAALRVAAAALAAYALAAVAIALTGGAARRAEDLGLLRALGLTRRQAGLVTVLEAAPLLVLTAVAGLAAGLAMPALIGIDLSAYAGGRQGALSGGALLPALPGVVAGALAAGVAAVALAGAYWGGRRGHAG
ncbi:FtsX-like permease family protein [Microbispora hainanensis]|uniref:ABC3 transporter permease C-terminal domain-containing protein n=2 Tax=Microbispora hainanensis TaxID=568844 RepID=A0ABZ1SWX2_9ACTN|nr:FtsX-like permease family protein [Microbispora hainanensis]